jgi:hypothetical protein
LRFEDEGGLFADGEVSGWDSDAEAIAGLSVQSTSRYVLFEIWHLPFHEFVEEGYGEGRLAVALTPDHAFVYQPLAHGRDGWGLDAEHGRNVACADLVRVPPSREDISAGAGSNGQSDRGRSWRPNGR